jgi:hypothetical protein
VARDVGQLNPWFVEGTRKERVRELEVGDLSWKPGA